MDRCHDVAELVGDLGFVLDVPGDCPLPELTAAVDDVCMRTEDRRSPAVIVLWLGARPSADRAWPGRVTIREVNRWERAVRRLEWVDAVTVAVAGDTCGGPALDLLLVADYRIATANLQLLLPVNDGHFWPGMALHRLANQVGVTRARRLVLWGDEVSARRAVDIGLVDEITADVREAVQAAAVLLGRASSVDLAVRRQLLLEAPSASFDEALGAHLAACDRELRRVYADGAADDATVPPEGVE